MRRSSLRDVHNRRGCPPPRTLFQHLTNSRARANDPPLLGLCVLTSWASQRFDKFERVGRFFGSFRVSTDSRYLALASDLGILSTK